MFLRFEFSVYILYQVTNKWAKILFAFNEKKSGPTMKNEDFDRFYWLFSLGLSYATSGSFPFVPPPPQYGVPPPSTVSPPLQSTWHYIVNHYIKYDTCVCANNVQQVSWAHKQKKSDKSASFIRFKVRRFLISHIWYAAGLSVLSCLNRVYKILLKKARFCQNFFCDK